MRAILAAVALALGFTVVGTAAAATPAHASCVSTPLTGSWHNVNANTNAMTRVAVSFTCSGGSTYAVHAWGKCHPTDCDWGVRTATNQGNGWIRAVYPFGFKTSYVWLRVYYYSGRTYLRVWVYNDFTPSDGRTDYTTDEWMIH